MMKDSFADTLKAQSDIWTTQVKEYQDRVGQMSDKTRNDYKKAMEEMESKAEEARKMADHVRGANEAAWKDMMSASQKAFVELQRGWADAVARFQ
jgi:uncharacterized coiled-coil DUF342 family protein